MAVGTLSGSVITLLAAADTYAGNPCIEFFHWVGATAGDDLLVKDTGGHTLWASTCDVTDKDQNSPKFDNLIVRGLVVTTMGSGILYVHQR